MSVFCFRLGEAYARSAADAPSGARGKGAETSLLTSLSGWGGWGNHFVGVDKMVWAARKTVKQTVDATFAAASECYNKPVGENKNPLCTECNEGLCYASDAA
jgi:hypothetical protein